MNAPASPPPAQHMLSPVVAHDKCGVWESTDVVLLRLTDVPEDLRPFQTGGEICARSGGPEAHAAPTPALLSRPRPRHCLWWRYP